MILVLISELLKKIKVIVKILNIIWEIKWNSLNRVVDRFRNWEEV